MSFVGYVLSEATLTGNSSQAKDLRVNAVANHFHITFQNELLEAKAL